MILTCCTLHPSPENFEYYEEKIEGTAIATGHTNHLTFWKGVTLSLYKIFSGVPVVVNGDEFQNIELQRVSDANNRGDRDIRSESRMSDTSSDVESRDKKTGEMLRDMVRNKDMMNRGLLSKHYDSCDSEMSDSSTVVSMTALTDDMTQQRRRSLITHHSIGSVKSEPSTPVQVGCVHVFLRVCVFLFQCLV